MYCLTNNIFPNKVIPFFYIQHILNNTISIYKLVHIYIEKTRKFLKKYGIFEKIRNF